MEINDILPSIIYHKISHWSVALALMSPTLLKSKYYDKVDEELDH